MKLVKLLLIIIALPLLLAACMKQDLAVILNIPGDYSVTQKLAIAQGVSQDIASPIFMNEVRAKFPSVSENSIKGLSIAAKQENKQDVAIEVRIEFKSGDQENARSMFEYVTSEVKSKIDYRIKHELT